MVKSLFASTANAINTKRGAVAAVLGALALAAVACNSVLGIESASLDPALSTGGDAAPTGSPCSIYCSSIMSHCTGLNLEYTDVGTCMAMCQHFEPGLPNDTAQDSLACRTYHAGAAAGDPGLHCRHAGPVGGGTCGDDPCSSFCLLDFALCGDLAPPPYTGGESGCRTACKANLTYVTADAGDINKDNGDTLNCRIYHLEAAYEPDNPLAKSTHCQHTAIQSATCSPPVPVGDGGTDGG